MSEGEQTPAFARLNDPVHLPGIPSHRSTKASAAMFDFDGFEPWDNSVGGVSDCGGDRDVRGRSSRSSSDSIASTDGVLTHYRLPIFGPRGTRDSGNVREVRHLT